MTLTFDLTHYLDHGCFKVKFQNSCISGIVGLIDVKWNGSELTWYWADCMTLPFDHTHNLDFAVLRSESKTALSQEWVGQLTCNQKDVSHAFMTMILTYVAMVGWADVPENDQGDFRRWCVVDISSLQQIPHTLPIRARCGCLTQVQKYDLCSVFAIAMLYVIFVSLSPMVW